MSEVTREHKAGLELALSALKGDMHRYECFGDVLGIIEKLIAQATAAPVSTTSDQYRAELYDEMWAKARSMGFGNIIGALTELERMKASASPEQEPSLWVNPNYLWRNGKQRQVIAYIEDNRENYTQGALPIPLYTRAEPSEVAQLRADVLRLRDELAESDRCVVRALNERDAATQRADAAERKLASVAEYVQGMVNAAGNQPSVATGYLRDILEALLSASAEPASPWIKCSDRLPDREQRTVAVLFDDGEPGVAWAGYWSGARTDFAGWQFPVDDLGADRIVTHWMPLPAAPAKGGDGEVQS